MSLETVSPTPRVVLITGAATGIGKACADRLASSGWRVFGGARGVSQLDSRVEMIVMDVNDEASVQDALTLVLAKAGRLEETCVYPVDGLYSRGSSMKSPPKKCSQGMASSQAPSKSLTRSPE